MSDTFKHKDKGKFHNKILKYDEVCESTKQMWDRRNCEWGEFRKVKKDLIDKIAEKEMKNTIDKEALKELEDYYKGLEEIENKYSTKKEYNSQKFEYNYEDYVNKIVYNLDRYTNLKNGNMLEDLDGEYVLFSDVLKAVSNLFSAKND